MQSLTFDSIQQTTIAEKQGTYVPGLSADGGCCVKEGKRALRAGRGLFLSPYTHPVSLAGSRRINPPSRVRSGPSDAARTTRVPPLMLHTLPTVTAAFGAGAMASADFLHDATFKSALSVKETDTEAFAVAIKERFDFFSAIAFVRCFPTGAILTFRQDMVRMFMVPEAFRELRR